MSAEDAAAYLRDAGEAETEELRQEKLNEYRRLRNICLGLFGPPERRTPLGSDFLEALDRECGRRKLQVRDDRNGRTDIFKTARALGRRDIADMIHSWIEWSDPDADRNRNIDAAAAGRGPTE